MKFKKVAALCMAMAMITSALTACGNQEATPSSSEVKSEAKEDASSQPAAESSTVVEEESNEIVFPLAETMEFTTMAVMHGENKVDETAAFITATEMANLDVEVINVSNSEAIEKGNLLIASGEYPDFFFKVAVDVNNYGMEGVFIPLEDLIREYAPNLTKLLDERKGWEAITAPDGHVYSLPYVGTSTPYGGEAPAWINTKWLDNLGLEMPETLDELYTVLKAFAEQDANGNGDPNDEIPYSFSTNTFTPDRLLLYMPDATVNFETYMAYMGANNDELVYYPTTDSFKENYLGFLKKCWDAGAIDKNAFTQTYEQMSLVGKAADVFGFFMRSAVSGQTPEGRSEEWMVWDCPNPNGLPVNNGIVPNGMAITDLCENPEVLVAWADYFYTEEGARLAQLGVENEHYTVTDGMYIPIENTARYGGFTGTLNSPMKKIDIQKFIDSEYTLNLRKEKNALFTQTSFIMPTLILTEEENEIYADVTTDIKAYISQYTAQVVTGQLDLEDSWDDYLKTLEAMGVDKISEVWQNAYARYLEGK